MTEPKVTAASLREMLNYDPATGQFFWRERSADRFESPRRHNNWNARYAGKSAGGLDKHGYLVIRIERRIYFAHRLAWLWVHGEWPERHIDHINRVRFDNRIRNLRVVTNAENNKNQSLRSSNRYGTPGIRKRGNGFEARITSGGITTQLGTFESLASAISARRTAAASLGFAGTEYQDQPQTTEAPDTQEGVTP